MLVFPDDIASTIELRPDLVDLAVRVSDTVTAAEREALRACAGATKLQTLGVTTAKDLVTVLGGAPVLERISTLKLLEAGHYIWRTHYASDFIESLAQQPGALRTIDIELWEPRTKTLPWSIQLQRDKAPGPFTRLRARWPETSKRAAKHLADDCNMILAMAPGELTDVEIDLGRPMQLPTNTVRAMVEKLDAMKHLEHVRVPWPYKRSGVSARWDGVVWCSEPLTHTPTIWSTFVEDLAASFDMYSINDRGTPALRKSPAANAEMLASRASSSTTNSITLARKGTAEHVEISRWSSNFGWSVATARTAAAMTDWFVDLISKVDATHASLWSGHDYSWRGTFSLEGRGYASLGWIMAFAPEFKHALTPNARAALLAAHNDVRIIDAPKHFVLQVGDDPSAVTIQRGRELARAVLVALDHSVPQKPPSWFHPLVDKIVAPAVAKKQGHDRTFVTPVRVVWGDHERYVVARLVPGETDGWRVYAEQAGDCNGTLVDGPAPDAIAAEELLLEAAVRMR